MSKDSSFDFSRYAEQQELNVVNIDTEILFAEISSAADSRVLKQAYELADKLLKLNQGETESEAFTLGLKMMEKILARAADLYQKKEVEFGRQNLDEDEEFTELRVLIDDTTRKKEQYNS